MCLVILHFIQLLEFRKPLIIRGEQKRGEKLKHTVVIINELCLHILFRAENFVLRT